MDKIVHQFAKLVPSAAESEAITRFPLQLSIDDILEEDSFSVVRDEGQLDPGLRPAAGYLGIFLHGSESHCSSGLTYLNFESIDIATSPQLFACLDEGCSSSCHSSAWAAEPEQTVARFGYTLPLKDDGKRDLLVGAVVAPRPKGYVQVHLLWCSRRKCSLVFLDAHQWTTSHTFLAS